MVERARSQHRRTVFCVGGVGLSHKRSVPTQSEQKRLCSLHPGISTGWEEVKQRGAGNEKKKKEKKEKICLSCTSCRIAGLMLRVVLCGVAGCGKFPITIGPGIDTSVVTLPGHRVVGMLLFISSFACRSVSDGLPTRPVSPHHGQLIYGDDDSCFTQCCPRVIARAGDIGARTGNISALELWGGRLCRYMPPASAG